MFEISCVRIAKSDMILIVRKSMGGVYEMNNLFDLLNRLEEKKIFFKLSRIRESILVEVTVPGQRWENRISSRDNHFEIDKFLSDGTIYNGKKIEELFNEFSDN